MTPSNGESNSLLVSTVAWVATAFVFFPYCVVIPTQSDVQPNAVVACTLAIALFGATSWKDRTPGAGRLSPLRLLFFIAVYACAISVVRSSISVRSLSGYWSCALVALFGYLATKRGLLKPNQVAAFLFVWCLVGCVQHWIWSDFATQILPRAVTSEDRGVVGLAPEPSYYSISCVFMFILVRMLERKGRMERGTSRFLQAVAVLQILVLAQSAIGILLMAIYLAVWAVISRKIGYIAAAGVAAAVLLLGAIKIYPESRVASLWITLWDDPSALLLVDASINERAAHVFLSLYGFATTLPFAFGYGTGSWSDYLSQTAPAFPDFFAAGDADRIMSGVGGALFELGLAGALLPIAILWSFMRHKDREMTILGVFVAIAMFAAIPTALPIFGFALGVSEGLREPA